MAQLIDINYTGNTSHCPPKQYLAHCNDSQAIFVFIDFIYV
jgi:hypothetical protein